MQDPIRQPGGWNHNHRPPPIPYHRIYLFPFTSCFWILRIDFYMYMCALGMGLMVVVAEGGGCMRCVCVLGGAGDALLMGEWRAWKWRAGWLNACPSLPILLVTGGLSFSPDRRISACLYMTAWARQFACTTDNKRACACQNRWRCVTVSTQCCLLLAWPSTSCHVSFHNQGKGKTGRRNHPAFLPASFCCCLFGINLIPMPLAMPLPSHFLLFLVCFVPSCWLSASPPSPPCPPPPVCVLA